MKIDESGMIGEGPYEGLFLRPLLDAMRNSSWDWPSAMTALEIEVPEDLFENMHPGEADLEILKKIAPEENWEDFSLEWDT